jgi:hypothetical protein
VLRVAGHQRPSPAPASQLKESWIDIYLYKIMIYIVLIETTSQAWPSERWNGNGALRVPQRLHFHGTRLYSL